MTFNAPYTPHKGIVINQETYKKILYNQQKIYMIGIGSLLHLVKHSRPKLCNAVRELSKCMDKANMSHYKVLLRKIKYVIDTKYYCY